jgi:hypothetical protein
MAEFLQVVALKGWLKKVFGKKERGSRGHNLVEAV